jgi:hypothetical protein
VLSLLGGAMAAAADPGEAEHPRCFSPTPQILGGHAFLPSFIVPQPFIETSARLAAGGGVANFDVPFLQRITPIRIAGVIPEADVSAEFWGIFALQFGVTGALTTGITAQSALIYGASTSYDLHGTFVIKLFKTDQVLLSAALRIARPRVLALSPVSAALGTIQNIRQGQSPDVISDAAAYDYRPDLRFAYGVTPYFGVILLGGFSFQTVRDNEAVEVSSSFMRFGGQLSFDLDPLAHFPVGFTANYLRTQVLSGPDPSVNNATVGIYETVSKRVNFGGEIGFNNIRGRATTMFALVGKSVY